MRILMLSAGFSTPDVSQDGGGSGVVARTVADALIGRGHIVAVLRARPASEVADTSSAAAVYDAARRNIYHWTGDEKRALPARLLWHLVEDRGRPSRTAIEVLDRLRPDIIASHNVAGLGTQIWRVAAARGIPIVHALHDYYLICPRTTRFRAGSRCEGACASCLCLSLGRRAAACDLTSVVSVSRYVLGVHLAAGLFADIPHTIIPNASAPILRHAPWTYDGSQPLRIGFMGRGSLYKGLSVLADAFDEMRDRNSRLVVAGVVEPGMADHLRRMKRAGDVRMIGYVDPDTFAADVDVVVVPSLGEETFSLVVAEALARGRAVIASRIGGIPEAIGSQNADWLFPPGDHRALSALLDRAAAGPAMLQETATTSARQAARWTTDDMAAAYESAYLSAINAA